MEIIAIFPPYIYSIKYDDKEENEYDRLFDEWNDLTSVLDFLMQHKEMLKASVWKKVSEPELAARQVLDEAEALELLFEELNNHTANGEEPDYDSHFHYLDGKYKFELEYEPMKSYGDGRPSLLRMYAIKMDKNTYSCFASSKLLIILSLREKSGWLRRKSNWRFAWKSDCGNISSFRFPPQGSKISARRALDFLPLGNLRNLKYVSYYWRRNKTRCNDTGVTRPSGSCNTKH